MLIISTANAFFKGNISNFLLYFKEHTSISSQKLIIPVPLLNPMICLIEVWIGSYPARFTEDIPNLFQLMWLIANFYSSEGCQISSDDSTLDYSVGIF